MASRYWAYLFENLERSITEIYDTCEKQDSIIQCKEVLLILENYKRDFSNLIEWLNLKWTYDQTPVPNRPHALAWEIRKPSFSALPHTSAYEIFVRSTSSENRVEPKIHHQPAAVPIEVPIKEMATVSPAPVIVYPTPSENIQPQPSVPTRVEIGLQTDLEEDPDNYYFAGGRHVGSQTDYNDEFGPLDLFAVDGPSPLIVLLTTSDCASDLSRSQPELQISDSEITSTATPPLIGSTTSVECETSTTDPPETVAAAPAGVETKSSFTQLSVGVSVLSESAPDVQLRVLSPNQSVEPTSTTVAETDKSEPVPTPVSTSASTTVAQSVSVPPPAPTHASATPTLSSQSKWQRPLVTQTVKSQFVPKCASVAPRTTSIRPTRPLAATPRFVQPKSFTVGRPNTAAAFPPLSAASTVAKTHAHGGPNVTAAQRAQAVAGKRPGSGISAAAPVSAAPVVPSRVGVIKSKSMVNPSGFMNRAKGKNVGEKDKADNTPIQQTKSFASLPDESLRSGRRASNVDEDGWETVRNRSSRSKFSLSNSSLHSSNTTLSRNSLDKGSPVKIQKAPDLHLQGGDGRGRGGRRPQTAASVAPSVQKRNEAQAPKKPRQGPGPVTTTTARPTQPTSKFFKSRFYQPSTTASLPVLLLQEEDGNGNTMFPALPSPAPVPAKVNVKVKGPETTVVHENETDETEIECGVDSVDEEAIKQKEAALDKAIREEELLEEELLQVEKDFEEIENQSNNGDDAMVSSENDNLASSPEIPEIELESSTLDTEKEKDDFFFVGNEARAAGEFLPREPGRIVALRNKLMSPARKFDSAETLKRHNEKLAKAERNRETLLQCKYNRYVELSDRFESLNESTKRLVEERAELIIRAEEKRKRAAEKRQLYLKGIKEKAHDEDSKLKEIAFINQLEAQNKRHDYLASAQEVEGRLQMREEERKLKLEERGTKANAVLERQFRIRNNWESKLSEIQEKRRRNEERIAREKEEKAKERSDLAQEKARDREERMSAMNAAKQAEKEELQKKIQQRQEDTARRHDENIEQIRQKAIELSVPRTSEDPSVQSSVRLCTLCQVTMQSEVQELAHLRGRPHLEAIRRTEKDTASNSSTSSQSQCGAENFGIKFIADVQADKLKTGVTTDKNRAKTQKKYCKKLLQKLETSGREFEAEEKAARVNKPLPGDQKLVRLTQKNLKEIGRLTGLFNSSRGSIQGASNLDHLLRETKRLIVRNPFLQNGMIMFNGFEILSNVLACRATDLPTKVTINACHFITAGLYQNATNGAYLLKSSFVCSLIEFAADRWNALVPDDNRWLCGSPLGPNEPLPVDPTVDTIMELLMLLLSMVADPFNGIKDKTDQVLKSRTLDIIGYLVGSGVIDRFSVYCSAISGPVDNQPMVADLLHKSIDLIIALVYVLSVCWDRSKAETTQLLATLESSELAGAVAMSYSLLLHQGAPTRPRQGQGPDPLTDSDNNLLNVPPAPGLVTGQVVKSAMSLVNALAHLDLKIFQNLLGSEAMSLQFRHIASQLLWQVVPHRTENIIWARLLNELFDALGSFTVLNKQNQVTIQSGQTPTILQQLCAVPNDYYIDPKLSGKFFPTLIACTYGCPENEAVLVQENINPDLLIGFLKSKGAQLNRNTQRILDAESKMTNGSNSNGNANSTVPAAKKSKKSSPS